MLSEGLEQLAGQTRGSMSVVNGAGKIAFDRIGRELSGYYLLGFEPTEADRTGARAAHQGRGEDARRSPCARDRPSSCRIRGDRGERRTLTPMEQLGEVLTAPLPARGLPMRVATYTAIESGDVKVRVIISAEIGDRGERRRRLAGRHPRLRQGRQGRRQSRRRSTLAPASTGLDRRACC